MPDDPPSRAAIGRDHLAAALREGFATIPTLARKAGLTERQVQRELASMQVERETPTCERCGHAVEVDDPFARPSRCPECHADAVSAPRFRMP